MAWVASSRRVSPAGPSNQRLFSEQIAGARRLSRACQVIVACGAIGVACGQASRLEPGDGGDVGSDVTVEWTLTPDHPAAGVDTVAEVTLRDRSRRPIRGATVQIECHMSHPGMAPVIEKAMERSEGVYQAPLQFSMNGDWTVVVKGTLSDGRRFDRRVETATVRQIR